MKHIIMQHKVYGLYQEELLLSTVKIGDIYETILMDEDFDELQMIRTTSREKAIANHLHIGDQCFEKAKAARHKLADGWKPWHNIETYNSSKWEPFA